MCHVRDYLKQNVAFMRKMVAHDWPYVNMDDFVLREGMEFQPSAKLPKGVKRGTMKLCYMNAFRLMLDRPELTYCEVYALAAIPVMHAWCCTADGTVVDPTWGSGRIVVGTEYLGIPFTREYVRAVALKRKMYGVIDYFEAQWPLLRGIDRDYRAPITRTVLDKSEVEEGIAFHG